MHAIPTSQYLILNKRQIIVQFFISIYLFFVLLSAALCTVSRNTGATIQKMTKDCDIHARHCGMSKGSVQTVTFKIGSVNLTFRNWNFQNAKRATPGKQNLKTCNTLLKVILAWSSLLKKKFPNFKKINFLIVLYVTVGQLPLCANS